MRVGIIGTGAIGSLFAAHIAPAAETIVLGTWQEAIEAYNRRGVWLEGRAELCLIPVAAAADPAGIAPVDVALIAVKGHQTERAARWAQTIIKPRGVALTLQNGLGNVEILAAHLGAGRAAVGVTMQGAMLRGPAHVFHAGRGLTTIGANSTHRDVLADVCALFNQAGLETQMTNDVTSLIWGKLVINSAINALTAIYRVPNGWLVENREGRALMLAAARETATVAMALGVPLPYPDPEGRALQVARATALNKSSTLQDILRGAPTELDRINGVVVREGRRLGVPTPVNEQLLRMAQNPRMARHRALAYAN